jgi:uncharacterized surface protein with fasciclin (FAS1) repeats
VQTVFAPSDENFDEVNTTSLLKTRQALTAQQQQQLLFHATNQQSDINSLSIAPGAVVVTRNTEANLNGNPQVIVSDSRPVNSSSVARRTPVSPRQQNLSSDIPLRLFSGLGNNVNIINADIQYDGGLIQTVNGFFTLPEPLSSTTSTIGLTSFSNATDAANLTAILDASPSITVFIPSNAAFASLNSSTIPNLPYHIVPNFAGYLPLLKNGALLTTQAGTNVTVSVRGNDFYINDARIISANIIIANGVAHVLDQVLTPSTSGTLPQPVFSGSSPPIVLGGLTKTIVVAWGVFLLLALGF